MYIYIYIYIYIYVYIYIYIYIYIYETYLFRELMIHDMNVYPWVCRLFIHMQYFLFSLNANYKMKYALFLLVNESDADNM